MAPARTAQAHIASPVELTLNKLTTGVQSLLYRHLFQVSAAEPAEETRQSGVPSPAQPGTHVRIIQGVPEVTNRNTGGSNATNIYFWGGM
jgi:hypothetical protein